MRRVLTWLVACSACLATAVQAQQGMVQRGAPPHVGYVYPAGGRPGTTFTITVGGQALGPGDVLVTGRGVQARFVSLEQPLGQKEFQAMREAAEKLQAKRRDAGGKIGAEWTAEDEKALLDMRQKLMLGPANRQVNPAIAERAAFEVTLGEDIEPGPRELRFKTAAGISNPVIFEVGQLPEFGAAPARPDPMRRREAASGRAATPPAPDLHVTLPATVNGQIQPGEVDHIRFPAKRGQRIVVAAAARALIPYLADAVPGWFQATVTVRDSEGRQLAFADDFAFNPDPALVFQIPHDGDYVVDVADAIFRGREDFVYRLTLGEVPFITGIFPLGGPATRASEVAVEGWNLPSTRARIDGAAHGAGEFRLALRRDGVLSNAVPFEVGGGREVDEPAEPARTASLVLDAPVTVNGRIAHAGEEDVFTFRGRAAEKFVAEITARRLNSPLDSIVRVTDENGTQLAANDDSEDRASGLTTHHADSREAFELPAAGTFHVHVGDAQHRGGSEYGYRLQVGPPQPGFDVRIVPSSITVRGGTSVPVTAHVLRHDGFSGPVALALRDAPSGLALHGARIPAGQSTVRFTITAEPTSIDRVLALHFEARGTVDGRTVVQRATPADDMMQAFAYRHLVPAQVLLLDVVARGGRRMGAPWVDPEAVVRIESGGTGRISVGLPRIVGDGKLVFELSDAPEGLVLSTSRVRAGAVEFSFAADATRLPAGQEGNLIVLAFLERAPSAEAIDKKTAAAPRRMPLGALPAIPYQVLAERPAAASR